MSVDNKGFGLPPTGAPKKEAEQEDQKTAQENVAEDGRVDEKSKQAFEQREQEIAKKILSGEINAWDTEVGEFEKEKMAEMKKNAPLFFIYRDNELFRKHLPIVQKQLLEMGRELEAQVFPQGTSKEDIKKWYAENINVLSQKAVMSDQTARIPYDSEKKTKYELGARTIGSFDELTSRVLEDVLLGAHEGEYNRGKSDRENSAKLMIILIKNILENPVNRPEKVKILSSNMDNHLGDFDNVEFVRGQMYTSRTQKEAIENYPIEENMLEQQKKQVHQSREAACIKNAVEFIKLWLIESGFVPEQIEIIDGRIVGDPNRIQDSVYFDDVQKKFLEEVDAPNTWVITDRHTGITNDLRSNAPLRSATVLRMPQSNFFDDAMNHNLVSCSEEKLEAVWERILKSEFGK